MTDFYKLIEEIRESRQKAAMLDKLGEVTTEITESDKAGYDWRVYKVNGIEVSKEYVENGLAKGTEDSPINFVDGMAVKPNTFYYHDEKIYVYMGAAMEAENWEAVSDYMAEWYIEPEPEIVPEDEAEPEIEEPVVEDPAAGSETETAGEEVTNE